MCLSFVIYELDPQPRTPQPSSKGLKARRLVTGHESLNVEKFVESCPTKDWRVYNVRETTRSGAISLASDSRTSRLISPLLRRFRVSFLLASALACLRWPACE